MIVCSCAVVTDHEIEKALEKILALPDAPLPTPGVVYRHLERKIVCGSCTPLVVSTIYEKVDKLLEAGLESPYADASLREKLLLRRTRDETAFGLIERSRPRRR